MSRIVIWIEGGNVQAVYSSDADDVVEVIDFDIMETNGISQDKQHDILDGATKGLKEVW